MKASTLLMWFGGALLAVSGGLIAYDWYAAAPPKFSIAVTIPENIAANEFHTIPAVIDNGTRRRLRIVGWTAC